MRADGKRLRNTDPMYTVASYVMSKRVDSMNMVTLDIPYDPIQEYLNKKRKESVSLSHLGVIIAAYLRTAAEFPLLNRFIMNCKPYARNEFCVAMVVLKSGQMDNGTMSKMYFNMTDTIFDVNNTINKYVTDNREVPRRSGGEVVFERCIPLGVVMDERICSGSYFALAFRKIRKYLRNPELLELPPEVVNEDPDK